MADLKPRRVPRQERSRANVDALLDATARLLREDGYAALTTNRIAERAGVSIGTLYQFFPGKEAVVAALAERRMQSHFATVREELAAELAESNPDAAFELLVRRIAKMLGADHRLHAVLLREVPFLKETQLVRESVDALVRATRAQIAGSRGRRDDAEIWLMGRMAYEALVSIAVFRESPASVDRSVDAFVRLLLRMIGGDAPRHA